MKQTAKFTAIDVEKWPRRTHFESFSSWGRCMIHCTADIDVTKLYNYCKKNGKRFYPMSIVLVSEAVNSIPELRTSLAEDKTPGVWNFISPTYTVFHDDDKTFSSINSGFSDDREEFYDTIISDMERCKNLKGHIVTQVQPNLLAISCIPNLKFSSFEIQHFNDFFVPCVIIGKRTDNGNGQSMPVSFSIHHALADGYHVGEFFGRLQELCNTL